MRRRHKRQNSLVSQMNVVPYIDVMLVLLIIFMVTSPMFTPGIINLPKVGNASQISASPLEIIINKNGDYSLRQDQKNIRTNDLFAQINSIATKDSAIVISADKDIKYDKVIKVIDKLYSLGYKKVALIVGKK